MSIFKSEELEIFARANALKERNIDLDSGCYIMRLEEPSEC